MIFPVTIFGSSGRILSKCHLAFLHICLIISKSNNTIMSSSKSFTHIFKATERPFNMIYSFTERHQHSRAADQSTHIPSPSKHTGMTATAAFPDTSSHSLTRFHKQIWESMDMRGWILNCGIGIFFAFMNHLNIPWHPSATKTQGAGVQAHSQRDIGPLQSIPQLHDYQKNFHLVSQTIV